jgi:hypothetical protein
MVRSAMLFRVLAFVALLVAESQVRNEEFYRADALRNVP